MVFLLNQNQVRLRQAHLCDFESKELATYKIPAKTSTPDEFQARFTVKFTGIAEDEETKPTSGGIRKMLCFSCTNPDKGSEENLTENVGCYNLQIQINRDPKM